MSTTLPWNLKILSHTFPADDKSRSGRVEVPHPLAHEQSPVEQDADLQIP